MASSVRKFSPLGRQKFEESLEKLHGNFSSAEFALRYLRPKMRRLLVAIAAGEAIHPEIVRMQLGIFVKSAVLRAEVYTIPTKLRGLRIQSSEVHIGVPGVGKGLGCSWADMILEKSKKMAKE